MPYDECKTKTAHLSKFLHGEQTICIRNEGDGGIYKGDIGSPLVSSAGQLVGIASWFSGDAGKPDIYTAIAPYKSWILSLVQEHESIFSEF